MITPDDLWLLLAALLVFSMQAGFLLLETGRVRAKNSVSVAQKNVSDMVVAWTAFFCFGYWVMFAAAGPLAGADGATLHFLYQLGFCAAAASIVSGGVAERISYRAYLALSALTAALIYPLVGRWVWGGVDATWSGSWLERLGFVDFAGGTVVHGVGAWVALAAIHAIGPRRGRFDAQGRVRPMPGHNAVLSLLGVLVLLVGWFGFNAGALSPGDPRFVSTIVATVAAAAFGALAGMALGVVRDGGTFNPSRVATGLLGGLVATTACANLVSAREAVALGLAGGAVATLGADWLLHRRRLDDPLDVVATHGLAGALGTLAVAFVGEASALPAGSRTAQAGVQLAGIVVVFAFAYGLARLGLAGLARLIPLRVEPLQEELGLNQTEHGEALGTERLQRALNDRLGATDGSVAHDDGARRDERSAREADAAAEHRTTPRLDIATGDDAGELAVAMNALLDRQEAITARVRASQRRFEQFALTSSDWLWETDAEHRFAFVSTRDPQVDDGARAALLGRPLPSIVRLRAAERALVAEAIGAREPLSGVEASLLLDDGTRRTVEMSAVPDHDEKGTWRGYRGTFQDVTERRGAERRAVFLARHDTLTGLANRRALTEDVAHMLASVEPERGLVIACVDLDGFKAVNDGHGHATGDRLLQEVAGRLKDSLRAGDRVFRTGGDEFVLVLPGMALASIREDALAWGERLVERLSGTYEVTPHRLEIGASVGVALAPEHDREPDRLMHLADLALYAAKAGGKGRTEVFDPAMDVDAKRQVELEDCLRTALDNDELTVQYQPQYEALNPRPTGFEALLRWTHPALGPVSPAVFVPVAERLGLMDAIGLFVLRTACRFAASWPESKGGAPTIAVNVSPSQFDAPDFVSRVRAVLDEVGLSPARLELEITEELLVDDFARMHATLSELRATGISIAVDDFGSGQTSLRYLNRLPITKLKIDRAFVSGLENDDRAQEITQSIVALGHRLGCRVVAEGVEDDVQARLLNGWACDQMQGYLYARPMDPGSVTEMLARDEGDADGTDAHDERRKAA